MSRDEADQSTDETADQNASDGESVTEDDGEAGSAEAARDQDTEPATQPEASDSEAFGIGSKPTTARTGDTQEQDDPRELAPPGESPSDEGTADGDAPLSSLASSVSDRRADAAERPDGELFDQEDVPEIDADVVWERLGEDEPPEVPDDTEHDVRVVEKRSYCEQCPFFSTPPDVGCDHEGTEILELVDMEHFRVVDCPKVLEDERLERL